MRSRKRNQPSSSATTRSPVWNQQVPPALDRRLRQAPVATCEGERLVGADDELAGRCRRNLDVVVVDDLGLEAGHRAPHPARALLSVAGADRQVRLRHPVAFDDRDAEAIAEHVPQGRRRRRGEGDPDAVRAVEGDGSRAARIEAIAPRM